MNGMGVLPFRPGISGGEAHISASSSKSSKLGGFRNGLKLTAAGYLMKFKVAGVTTHRATGTSDREEAKALLLAAKSEALKAARANTARPQKLPPPSFAFLVEHSAALHPLGASSDRHLNNVLSASRLHLGRFNSTPIHEIRALDVATLKADLLKTLKPTSVNHVLATLRLLLRWAHENELMDVPPPKIQLLKVQRTKRPTLSADAEQKFLIALDAFRRPDAAIAVRFMLYLGLRDSEVNNLRWEWLDIPTKTYTHQATKGMEASPLRVPDDLLMLLLTLGPKPSGLILTQADGRPHTRQFTRKAIHFACREAGLPLLSGHRLRSTFGTLHALEGVPLPVVQRLMRHRNIQTTMRYIEVDQTLLDEAQERREQQRRARVVE